MNCEGMLIEHEGVRVATVLFVNGDVVVALRHRDGAVAPVTWAQMAENAMTLHTPEPEEECQNGKAEEKVQPEQG